jgi:hypothetical protein
MWKINPRVIYITCVFNKDIYLWVNYLNELFSISSYQNGPCVFHLQKWSMKLRHHRMEDMCWSTNMILTCVTTAHKMNLLIHNLREWTLFFTFYQNGSSAHLISAPTTMCALEFVCGNWRLRHLLESNIYNIYLLESYYSQLNWKHNSF